MGRTTLSKSKTRIICLTDEEEDEITAIIGNGSRTAGVRRMLDLVKAIAKQHGEKDLKAVVKQMFSELGD